MRKLPARLLALALVLAALPAHAADVWFNSEDTTNLTGEILASFDRNVAAAAGKQTDIYVNIFAFTERTIAEKMMTVALSGSVSPCTVLVTTAPGQTAATVAANLAAALNADSCVNAQGITASASGGTLQLRGFLLRLLDVVVADPGLEAEVPIAAIPTLSTAGLALMALLILVAVLVLLRRRPASG